jgi:hypothetical protein
MMVIVKDSICGILRGPSIQVVGRFKLSEIGNMDQSPLAFEFLKGQTYEKRGERTVCLKGAKSGWEKRQCTLQIIVFADGVARCKPLLMFKGKPKSKDRRRIVEFRKYHPGVVVIFNEKAYANTSNLIDWVKNRYSMASLTLYATTNLDSFPLMRSLHIRIRVRRQRRRSQRRQRRRDYRRESCRRSCRASLRS